MTNVIVVKAAFESRRFMRNDLKTASEVDIGLFETFLDKKATVIESYWYNLEVNFLLRIFVCCFD